MRWGLKNKLIANSVILLAVSMGLVCWLAYYKAAGSLKDEAGQRIVAMAANTARNVESWTADRASDLRGWSGMAAVRHVAGGGMGVGTNEFLRGLIADKPVYEMLAVADSEGTLVAASDEKVVDKVKVSDREYFRRAMSGQFAMSPVLISKQSGHPSLVFASPVLDRLTKKVLGVVLATVNLSQACGHLIDCVDTGGTGYLYAADANGMVVTHPDKNNILKLDLTKYDFGREIMSLKNGLIDYVFQGVGKVVGVAPVPSLGWIVAATADHAELYAPARQLGWFIAILGLVMIVAGAIFSWLLARTVVGPVAEISRNLAEGAGQVAAASEQVSSASQTMAEGASRQAAGLEHGHVSLEEVNSQVQENTGSAREAAGLVDETKDAVSRAGASLEELRLGMTRLTQASVETGKIIKTIDEIAFQTNLLALNAAVEAARAGEAGAGFAVVADEVRNLAMRAAEAARNTAGLIEQNLREIDGNSRLVSTTSTSFVDLEERARRASELMRGIMTASEEQAMGVGQLTESLRDLDRVVQENAGTSEESASAAEELAGQAESLADAVEVLDRLVIGGNGRAAGDGRHAGDLPGGAARLLSWRGQRRG